jgi:rare lipoprotein A
MAQSAQACHKMCATQPSIDSPNRDFRGVVRFGVLAAFALVLTACAQTQLAVYAVKEMAREAPAGEGTYKVGKPYQINGIWYTPAEDPAYNKTGIASWYGRPFHGQRTANGEIYDMNALTAAHKTLPMPSYVRVTNLENGRSLILRLNDRGPFVNGRIIDVSFRAAQLLGFYEKGTARTQVEIVDAPSESLIAARAANLVGGGDLEVAAAPLSPVAVDDLPPLSGVGVAPVGVGFQRIVGLGVEPGVTVFEVAPTEIYIQAGAFAVYDSANKLRLELEYLGQVEISPISVDGRQLYRVRIGPIASVARADMTLAVVIDQGHAEARIVIE